MDTRRIIPISEARKRIFEIAEEVQRPDTHYVLTENGKPKAVILSAEEFENLRDDLDILSDPGLLKEIEEAEKEYGRGEYVTWEELKQELGVGQEELVMRDRGKERYRVKARGGKKKL